MQRDGPGKTMTAQMTVSIADAGFQYLAPDGEPDRLDPDRQRAIEVIK
jgi:hypothetical protein